MTTVSWTGFIEQVFSNEITHKYIEEAKIMNKPFEINMMAGHDTMRGLKALEAAYIEYVYELSKYNQSKAAKMLGISRGALRYKLKEYFGEKYI